MSEHQVEGFPPIAQKDAHILILGSAPSVQSLQQQQYYAHPRNSFWPILTTLLLGETTSLPYPERVELLKQKNIALWDVMRSCERSGSLDSNIANHTIETNPFSHFFETHPKISALFFNGGKAETVYQRKVAPTLSPSHTSLPQYRLPSTSPAMAMLSREEKLAAWRKILDYLR